MVRLLLPPVRKRRGPYSYSPGAHTCCYTEIAQRIFKHSDVQHTSLTPDEQLNIITQ